MAPKSIAPSPDREIDELVIAGAARDAAGRVLRPAGIAVRGGRIVAAGPPTHVARESARRRLELPRHLLLPPMVNAHLHLDLTTIGPLPYDGDFAGWLERVRARRPVTPDAIEEAVWAGAESAYRAGVGWVGDIAGSVSAVRALWRTRLAGVSYLERFGLTAGEEAAERDLEEVLSTLPKGPFVGVEPHAPYSAGLGVYRAAARLAARRGHRLASHLAESPEEVRFVRDASGPLVDLLDRLGKRPSGLRPTGQHPVDWLAPVIRSSRPWLFAHAHETEPAHWRLLADTRAAVAYCPTADAYFGRGGHPYRAMRDAGVNVVLGTDGIVSQSPRTRQPLGLLAAMRHLFCRDGTPPEELLAMATTDGLRALQLDPGRATLGPGGAGDLVAVPFDPDDEREPLAQVLADDAPADRLSALLGAARPRPDPGCRVNGPG